MSGRPDRSRLETVGFTEAVRGRASVRRFSPEPVSRADITTMVELAVRAANAGNAQMWRFVAVEDVGLRAAMRDAVDAAFNEMDAWPELAGRERDVKAVRAYATFFAEAPLVVAVLGVPYGSKADEMLVQHGLEAADRDRLRARPDLQSIGAAVQLLCTAAHAMGYGSCWMTAPVLAAPAIEGLLGADPEARLVALVPVGRPASPPRPSGRGAVEDILEFR